MTGPVIGGVAVEVVPDARKWVPRFRQQVLPGASKVGDEYGVLFGDEASRRATEAFERGLARSNPKLAGARQGDAFGDAFSGSLRKALDNLPKAKLDADATAAEHKVAEIAQQLAGLDSSFGVNLTDETALRLLGHLRLELDQLTLPEHDIRLRLNAGAASAELAAFEAKIAALSNNPVVPGGGSSGAGDGPELSLPSLKVAAIMSALPLVGPVASAASGGLLQFAGAAGVAGLAVKGLNNEIEQETVLGVKVKSQITGLTSAMTGLERTAARGASTGVLSGLQQVNDFLPRLNPQVDSLARHLGNAFSVGTGGLLSALQAALPLLSDAGKYAEQLAGKLASAARSPEFEHFLAYAREELPVVVHALTEVGGAAVHLVEALGPIGTVGIAVLDGVATTLNAIPVQVLTDLAVAATAGYVAFKGYAIISAVNIALTAYAERAAVAAGASAELAAANASATVGAGAMATKFGALTGIGLGLGAVLIGAQQLSKALATVPASTEVVTLDLERFSKTGELTARTMTDLGVKSKNLGSVMENAFRESNWTKIKDFNPVGDALGIHVQNATRDMQNFFKTNDTALESMIRSGDKLAADKALENWSRASGESVQTLLGKLPKTGQALQDIASSSAAAGLAAQAAAGSFEDAADKAGIGAKAAQSYAAMVGITAEEVGKGTVSQDALNAAVVRVAGAYNQASQSGSAYLASVDAFAQSAGTAADRAGLIGATLRASNGDALAYGGALTGATEANLALTNAFADQAAQASANSAAVQSAQAALSAASSQASRSLSNAIDGVATAERGVTAAQQAARTAQLALTDARKAAKVAAEDLANQVIDGQLSERQAVLSLKAARDALNKPATAPSGGVFHVGSGGTPNKTPTGVTAGSTPNREQQQLAYDQAVQQLKEIQLQNQRLAVQKAAADRAGINGSQQVIAAQQGVASATQGISDAQRNLAKSQQAVSDAQVAGAQAIATAQRAVTAASEAQSKALKASELAAVDAKTGLIDYGKQGAGPLVQQLQAMQDAAEKAAEATFQHELATKGQTVASKDAVNVYESLTRGALMGEYNQLGLTKDAAQHLADTYFKFPKDLPTTVEMIGSEGVESVLSAIGKQLALLTHEPWEISAHFADAEKTIKSLSLTANLLAYIRGDLKAVDIGVSGRGEAGGRYYANGGLDNLPASIKHFGNGSEQHLAQIAPAGAMRVWAEPETGGEAYIPLAESKRARSELILAEVARRFGDTLVKGGGQSGGSSLAGVELRTDSSAGRNVTVQQVIHNPLPEPASVSGPSGLRRAAYALSN